MDEGFGPLPSASSAVPSDDLSKEIDSYLAAIEQLEYQGGTYSDNLTQNLFQLGKLYQRQGKHANAVEVLERCLFLNRVNEGLYSADQVAVLEQIIHSLSEMQKWTLVNDRFAYLYWLGNKSLQHNQVKRAEITLKFAQWQLQAYSLGVTKYPVQNLALSYKLFDTATNTISKEHGAADLRLIEPLNGLLLTTYLAATNKPIRELNSMQRKGYANGVRFITDEINILRDQNLLDHFRITNAMLKLADWQLMYGKDRDAMSSYREAYLYAQTNEQDSKLVKALFTQPIALPHFPNYFHNNSLAPLSEQIISDKVKYVHASFNVTPKGNVRNIKVLGLNPPQQNGSHNTALRNLRGAKFRPQISDGVAILTEETQLHILVK